MKISAVYLASCEAGGFKGGGEERVENMPSYIF